MVLFFYASKLKNLWNIIFHLNSSIIIDNQLVKLVIVYILFFEYFLINFDRSYVLIVFGKYKNVFNYFLTILLYLFKLFYLLNHQIKTIHHFL